MWLAWAVSWRRKHKFTCLLFYRSSTVVVFPSLRFVPRTRNNVWFCSLLLLLRSCDRRHLCGGGQGGVKVSAGLAEVAGPYVTYVWNVECRSALRMMEALILFYLFIYLKREKKWIYWMMNFIFSNRKFTNMVIKFIFYNNTITLVALSNIITLRLRCYNQSQWPCTKDNYSQLTVS